MKSDPIYSCSLGFPSDLAGDQVDYVVIVICTFYWRKCIVIDFFQADFALAFRQEICDWHRMLHVRI